ncbi:uncharacterized protein LOC119687480 [Teleopsis dalmanni]|uniref:uncharacterized protein LOC119687480 n=1 Tax=Teleopsis dalmanni TaxID=139649 RepID=UPI0018CDC089|nr:uncharacterized protein LOC119687480 [Teleopsis dalmanni]
MYINKLQTLWTSILFVLIKNDIYSRADGPYCTYNRTKTENIPVWKRNKENEKYIEFETTIKWNLIQDCCEGYRKINQDICAAICSDDCDNNAICIAPDTCKCKDGYKEAPDNNLCLPNCEDKCPTNSLCIAPFYCECLEGYRKANDECVPICTVECRNSFCVAPEKCECYKNYELQDGSCQLSLFHTLLEVKNQLEKHETVTEQNLKPIHTTGNYAIKKVNSASFENSKTPSMNGSHIWGNILIACATFILLVLIAFCLYLAFIRDYGTYDVEDQENFHCDVSNNKNYNELRCD